MPRCFARGRRTWPGRCRRPCVRGDGREGDTPGDIRRAVEIALREWQNKSQQEIAEQVGCNVAYVNRIKQELFTSKKLTLPAKRMGKDGKDRPTTYATFGDYCRERWGMSRSYAHRMIESAAVVEMLPMGNKPASERQARPLAKLPPAEQPKAWQEAVTSAFTGPPTPRSGTTAGSGGG